MAPRGVPGRGSAEGVPVECGSRMTRMPCMRVRLRRAPRSTTPHGHRPRVDGPNTPGAPPPARPRAPVDIPAPTAKGSGPLWGLLWCDGGVWPWYPSLRGRRPLLLPTRNHRASCRGFSLRKAEGAKTMPRGPSARQRPRCAQAYAAAGPPAREREERDDQDASSPRRPRETRPVSQ